MRRILLALGTLVVVGAFAALLPGRGAHVRGTVSFASYGAGSAQDAQGGELRLWQDGRVRTLYAPPFDEIVESGAVWLGRDELAFLHGITCMSCPPPEVVLLDASGAERRRFSLNAPDALDREARRAQQVLGHRPGSSAVSPDGRWVAVAAGATIAVTPAGGGKSRVLARCPLRCADPAWRPGG
jgi:hypothetical protein